MDYLNPDLAPNLSFEKIPLEGTQRFYDKQGAVHARVSMNFTQEFNCLLQLELGSLDQ